MIYKTEQRIHLYSLFKKFPHRYFTVKEIKNALAEEGEEISVSTIYRSITLLIAAGIIKRNSATDSRETNYRFIGDSNCRNEIHVKCTTCGKIFHANHSLTEFLQQNLLDKDSFLLDLSKTILYGTCEDCRKKKSSENITHT